MTFKDAFPSYQDFYDNIIKPAQDDNPNSEIFDPAKQFISNTSLYKYLFNNLRRRESYYNDYADFIAYYYCRHIEIGPEIFAKQRAYINNEISLLSDKDFRNLIVDLNEDDDSTAEMQGADAKTPQSNGEPLGDSQTKPTTKNYNLNELTRKLSRKMTNLDIISGFEKLFKSLNFSIYLKEYVAGISSLFSKSLSLDDTPIPTPPPDMFVTLHTKQTIDGEKTISVALNKFTIADSLGSLLLAREGEIDVYKNFFIFGKGSIVNDPIEDNDIPNKRYVDAHGGTPPDTTTIRITDNKLEAFALKRTSDILDANNITDLTSQQTITGNKDFTGGNNRFVLTDANKFLRIGNGVQGEEITFNNKQVNFPSVGAVKCQGTLEALDPNPAFLQQVATVNYLNNNYPKKTDLDGTSVGYSNWNGSNKVRSFVQLDAFNTLPDTHAPGCQAYDGLLASAKPFGGNGANTYMGFMGLYQGKMGGVQFMTGRRGSNAGLLAIRPSTTEPTGTTPPTWGAGDTISTIYRHREYFMLTATVLVSTSSTPLAIASTIHQGRFATALTSNSYTIPSFAVVGDFLRIHFDLQLNITSGANPNIIFTLGNNTVGTQIGNTRIFQYSNQAGNTTFTFSTIPFPINTTNLRIGDSLEVRYQLGSASSSYNVLVNSYILGEIERGV